MKKIIYLVSLLALFTPFSSILGATTSSDVAPSFTVNTSLSQDQKTLTYTVLSNNGSGHISTYCGPDIASPYYQGGYYVSTPYKMIDGSATVGGISQTIFTSSMNNGLVSAGQEGTPCDSAERLSETGNIIAGTPASFSFTKTIDVSSLGNGSYVLSVKLNTSSTVYNTVSKSIVINNRVAPLSGGCSVPSTATVGQSVTWTSSVSGGTAPYSYLWNWSDGSQPNTTPSNTFTYNSQGTYSGTLTIRSADGQSVTKTCSVTVQGGGSRVINGYHDGSSGTIDFANSTECRAYGWATMNPDQYIQVSPSMDESVKVRIKSDGVVVSDASLLADQYRSDLSGVCNGGSCAFTYDLNGKISPNTNHTIVAEAQNADTGVWSPLSTTNKTLNCQSAQTGTVTVSTNRSTTWTLNRPSPNSAIVQSVSTSNTKTYTDQPTGTYSVTPASISGYSYSVTSSPASGTLTNGGTVAFTITYTSIPAGSGTVTVSSNRSTTWTLSGPTPRTETTNKTSATYTSQSTGTYSITPATISGYTASVSVSPTSGTLTNGGTVAFTITYTSNSGTGNVNVSSNLPTTWTLNRPSPNSAISETTSQTSKTYTGQPTGTYTVTPASKSGYTVAVSPTSGTLTSGGTTSFVITYTVIPATVVVNSNVATMWDITGPTAKSETSASTSKTYTSMTPGTYTITPTNLSGYSLTISPASSQSVSGGGTITFTLNYAVVATDSVSVTSNIPTTWVLNRPTPNSPITETMNQSSKTYTSQIPGIYSIIPTTIAGYSYTINPSSSQSLIEGGYISFEITYTPLPPRDSNVVLKIDGADSVTKLYGQTAVLSWQTANVSTCTAVGDWGGVKATGSGTESTGNLVENKTYTLRCTDSSGAIFSDTVTATVGLPATVNVSSNMPTTWSLTGPSSKSESSQITSRQYVGMTPGIYTLVPATISGYDVTVTTSSSQSVSAGGTITFYIDYAVPPPPPGGGGGGGESEIVVCNPTSITNVGVNQPATFTATGGGTGTITWTVMPGLGGSALSDIHGTSFNASWNRQLTAQQGYHAIKVTRSGYNNLDYCNVRVNDVSPDFSLSSSNNISSGTEGDSSETTITVSALGRFSGTVALSASTNVPQLDGARYVFIPTSLASSQYSSGSKFRVYLPTPIAPGSYPITIKGTSTVNSVTIIRTVDIVLTVSSGGGPGGGGSGGHGMYEEF